MPNKKAFTFVELLVCLAIFSVIIGIVIVMMNSGASNVHKGSFKALAANQALWIVTVMRKDFEKSIAEISFEGSENVWNGDNNLTVHLEGGVAIYSIEKNGNRIKFVRKFISSGGNSNLTAQEKKVQSFGDDYMTKLTLTRKNENGINSYLISITMEESNKSVGGNHDFIWTASIYPPKKKEVDSCWVSTLN